MCTDPSLAWITAGYENSISKFSSKVKTSRHVSPSSPESATLSTPLEIVLYASNKRPSLNLTPSIPGKKLKSEVTIRQNMEMERRETAYENRFFQCLELKLFNCSRKLTENWYQTDYKTITALVADYPIDKILQCNIVQRLSKPRWTQF